MKLVGIFYDLSANALGEASHCFHLCEHMARRDLDLHELTTNKPIVNENFPFAVYSLVPGQALEARRLRKLHGAELVC